MEEGKNSFKILTGKRTLVRPKRRWEGNIGINIKETEANMRNWVIRLRIAFIGESL